MAVPQEVRAVLRAELDALARSERPHLLTWVGSYGPDGATLVEQPEEIWAHPDSVVEARPDGTAWGTVPLWTTDETPGALCVEFEVDVSGGVSLRDVRVL